MLEITRVLWENHRTIEKKIQEQILSHKLYHLYFTILSWLNPRFHMNPLSDIVSINKQTLIMDHNGNTAKVGIKHQSINQSNTEIIWSVWRQTHYDVSNNSNKVIMKVTTHIITSITARSIGLLIICLSWPSKLMLFYIQCIQQNYYTL